MTILKRGKLFLTALVCTLFTGTAKSQMILKPTHIVSESAKHIDIFATIVRCDTSNQIHLKVLNESTDTQDLSMTVIVRNNSNGKSFATDVEVKGLTPTGGSSQGSCTGGNTDLVIKLPKEYEPRFVTIGITY